MNTVAKRSLRSPLTSPVQITGGRRDSPKPSGRTGMRRFARRLFRGRVARPGLVVGRYQPLADGGADAPAPPDHACPLQSLQKTKRNGLTSNPLVFGFFGAPRRKRGYT